MAGPRYGVHMYALYNNAAEHAPRTARIAHACAEHVHASAWPPRASGIKHTMAVPAPLPSVPPEVVYTSDDDTLVGRPTLQCADTAVGSAARGHAAEQDNGGYIHATSCGRCAVSKSQHSARNVSSVSTDSCKERKHPAVHSLHVVQRCLQCNTTTTPQWRLGPNGTNTYVPFCIIFFFSFVAPRSFFLVVRVSLSFLSPLSFLVEFCLCFLFFFRVCRHFFPPPSFAPRFCVFPFSLSLSLSLSLFLVSHVYTTAHALI